MSDSPISTHRTQLVLSICYASFSGIISGMCLLFAKSGVELLLVTLRGKNQFRHWEAWCLVIGLVAFALLQLWYLHKALVLADPTIVCPCEHVLPFIPLVIGLIHKSSCLLLLQLIIHSQWTSLLRPILIDTTLTSCVGLDWYCHPSGRGLGCQYSIWWRRR